MPLTLDNISTSTITNTTTLALSGGLGGPGGGPSATPISSSKPIIPYGGNELPVAKNCREANGTYDYNTGLCVPNVIASTPTLPSGQQAISTNKDNTQKYILYAILGYVAYKVFIK